ncbi:glucose-6-phosphatase catalytic subunit 1 [Danaus plexippus]|nr:glucose-6-phosphatase catalytic subunit 1 [Danaus plexippus]
MEQVYALGVSCIEFVQYWFEDWSWYFELVNHLSNPHNMLEILFPLISIFDSVFASQLLLVMAVGGWVNSITKWILLEDRPFWWVRETTFYTSPPQLYQTDQTCETGPGSPSGHSCAAAEVLILIIMWGQHIFNDRKWSPWWKHAVYPFFAISIISVMLARLYIATHFPHQCLLGAMIGVFLAPALCIYVSDPFIWRYGSSTPVQNTVVKHVIVSVVMGSIGLGMYWAMKFFGIDPHYTVQLAFRWCNSPSSIAVSTTPLYSLVHTTAAMLSWSLCVTPAVDRYRHNTTNRSLLISIFATGLSIFGFKQLELNITRANAFFFYMSHFILNTVKPAIFLVLIPSLSMWPYSSKEKIN